MSGTNVSSDDFIVLDSFDETVNAPAEAQLKNLLCSPDVAGLPVIPVCMIGAKSSGKSFLLNYMIRYLDAKSRQPGTHLGTAEQPLRGFPWKQGDDPRKPCVKFWNKLFILKISHSLKVAVLLMDTDGILDGSTLTSTAARQRLFHICLSAAPMLVYNVSESVSIQHLENIKSAAVSYEMAHPGEKFLGKLLVLIKDWKMPGEFPYGSQGGKDYLDHVYEIQQSRDISNIELIRKIDRFFGNIVCFLMPFPGGKVAGFDEDEETEKHFNGALKDVPAKYLEQIKHFIEETFSMNKLEPRCLQGQMFSCEALFSGIQSHLEDGGYIVVNSHQTQSEASKKAFCDSLLRQAVGNYETQMKKVLPGGTCLNDDDLAIVHRHNQSKIVGDFLMNMEGDSGLVKLYEQKLLKEIGQSFHRFRETNAANKKRPGSDAMTRATNEYTMAMEEATAQWAWYEESEFTKKHDSAVARAMGVLQAAEGLQVLDKLKLDLRKSCEGSLRIYEDKNAKNRLVSIGAKVGTTVASGVIVGGVAIVGGASPFTALGLAGAAITVEVVTNGISNALKDMVGG